MLTKLKQIDHLLLLLNIIKRVKQKIIHSSCQIFLLVIKYNITLIDN